MKKSKRVDHSFGAKGWMIVLYATILYLASSILGAIIQIAVPALVSLRGWSYTALMSFSTIGGWLSIPFTFLFAQVVNCRGVKWPTAILVAVYGIAIILNGDSSYTVYMTAVLVASMLSHSINMVSPNTLLSSWFPTKKGVVLGIATSGMMLSSILGAPLFQLMVTGSGISFAFRVLGVFVLLVALLTLLTQNTPQEAGVYPDNNPDNTIHTVLNQINITECKSQWNIGSLLASKNFWMIAIGYGLGFFVLIGASSFFIPMGLEYGLDQSLLLLLLMLGGIGSIVGSYVLGVVDQAVGTKPATILYGGGMVIGMTARALGAGSLPLFLFGIFCLTFFQGALANLMISMTMQVFGPSNYTSVNRVLSPIVIAIRTLAFLVVGVVYTAAGTYVTVCWVLTGVLVVSLLCLCLIDTTANAPSSN